MKVLIVCAGNTCRSPMAAGLLKLLAKEWDLDIEAQSAGLAHRPNTSVAKNAVCVMSEIGIDISGDYSKGLTKEALDWADVVVVVQRHFAAYLLEDHPAMRPKVHCLERDVDDPYGRPITEYRRVRDELRELLARLLQSLQSKLNQSAP